MTRCLFQGLVLLCGLALGIVRPALAQSVALVPNGSENILDLFEPGAPWQHAAAHVQAFGLSVRYLASQPDRDVQVILNGLRRLHIDASLDMLPLSGEFADSRQLCGFHVEGYSAPGEMQREALWFKAHNGEPQSYGMDEPLLYGHYYTGPNACRSPIPVIARDVANKIRQVRAIFPGVKVGDTEPIMALPEATWQADLEQWLDDFQADTGTPMAFFSVELDWRAPWHQRMQQLKALLARRHVPLGVVYNATGDPPDAEWVAQTAAHYRELETSVGVPDGVAFQSWVHHPARLLPETDPTTFTGMVITYVAWRATQR